MPATRGTGCKEKQDIMETHIDSTEHAEADAQSALPVLDSNETRHVISEVYNVVGEELEFAMQVT